MTSRDAAKTNPTWPFSQVEEPRWYWIVAAENAAHSFPSESRDTVEDVLPIVVPSETTHDTEHTHCEVG